MIAEIDKYKENTIEKELERLKWLRENMKITRVYLKNFKRFTELTIDNIPNDTKLVMLVGPNGCGKSSVFDAFERLVSPRKTGDIGEQADYHKKDPSQPIDIKIIEESNKEYSINNVSDPTLFYIRSPYRYSSEIRVTQISPLPEIKQDDDRPKRIIDLDQRLLRNYQRLIVDPISKLYKGELDDLRGKEIREKYLNEINNALEKILGDVQISDIGDPLDRQRGQLYFSKGAIKQFSFKNLGSGEKEIVDLIIDLIIKKQVFNNTIFCIDEPDLHINTAIQSKLLKKLLEITPDISQLWISTHSLGFIEEASKLNDAVIIDFSEKDFDHSQILRPIEKTKDNLRKIYKVALENLVDFVIPSTVIFCEGENPKGDEKLYKLIFSDDSDFKEIEFISSKSGLQTKAAVLSVLEPINRGLSPKRALALIDRDYRTDALVEEERSDHVKILEMYSLENYLLHPDNIKSFKEIDIENYRQFLIAKINERLVKLKEKVKSSTEYIKNENRKIKVKSEVESNNKLLKLDSIDKENFENIFKYIPIKELLGEIIQWYNHSYRESRKQYSKEKFLNESARIFGKNREGNLYKKLKSIILSE